MAIGSGSIPLQIQNPALLKILAVKTNPNAPLIPRGPRGTSAARPYAREAGYRHLVELAAQDEYERERGIRLMKVITGDPTKKYIALTFDDGPHGIKTQKLLDLLHHLQVPATFFVVGMQAQKFPDLIAQIALGGHELGNHTFHHYRLPRIPLEEVPGELNATRDVLTSILGSPSRLFRPPGGEYTPEILHIVERNGYVTVLWTDDPADFKAGRTPEQIKSLVLRDLTPGGIILLHDGLPATWAALPDMVARMRAKGLVFVTVSELIQRGGGLRNVREIRVSRTSAT